MTIDHYSFCETMSQVLLSWTLLTEFDLRSPSKWFEHSRFRNLLTMTLLLAFLKI